MAPILSFPYFRNSTIPPERSPSAPPTPLVPTPLRIFKRSNRNPSFTKGTPLSTLAAPPPTNDNDSSSTATYHSALSLPLITTTTTASTTTSTSPTPTPTPIHPLNPSPTPTCSLCILPLSPLQTYTFPRTAPAITAKVLRLFPRMHPNPTFCGTCFEAIHAVHLCWGCGEAVHREEERVGCGWAWWHWGCVRCLICRAPLPPPQWTSHPTTLSIPPSCKACTRELQHLAYQERIHRNPYRRISKWRLLRHSSSSEQDHLVHKNENAARNGASVYDGPASRTPSLDQCATPSCNSLRAPYQTRDRDRNRKLSFGVKYPPLPKWMIRPAAPSSSQSSTTPASAPFSHLPPPPPPPTTVDGAEDEEPLLATPDYDIAENVLPTQSSTPVQMPRWMEKLPGNRHRQRRTHDFVGGDFRKRNGNGNAKVANVGGFGDRIEKGKEKAKGAVFARRGEGGRVVSGNGSGGGGVRRRGRGFMGGRVIVV